MGKFDVQIKRHPELVVNLVKISIEKAQKLENDIRRTADLCSLVNLIQRLVPDFDGIISKP